jgi:16S rRNA (cytidine1402-2'-O)-methyltransferase
MDKQISFFDEKHTLYLVATPIGSMADITYNAVATLMKVPVILCEDTKVSSKLLYHYQIPNKLVRFNYHSEDSLLLLEKHLSQGDVAFISDAGMPAISDPGLELTSYAYKNNYNVVVIGGISSVTNAVAMSGLNTIPFTFLGFLPRKVTEIKTLLTRYKHQDTALVIFEANKRINQIMLTISEIFPNQRFAVLREISKKYETVYRGDFSQDKEFDFGQLGEFVIVIEKPSESYSKLEHLKISDHLNYYLEKGYNKKEAIKLVADDLNIRNSDVYNQLIKVKKD